MKNLRDVLEKLRVDDIVLNDKFPIDGTLDDMIEFLKDKGFKEVVKQSGTPASEALNKEKNKCFIKDKIKNVYHLWFANTSKQKISKDNPIFFIDETLLFYNVYYIGQAGYTVDIVIRDKKEFLKELNKRFGWK